MKPGMQIASPDLMRIKANLITLLEEHQAACPEPNCQEALHLIAFLCHGLGLGAEQVRLFLADDDEYAFHVARCAAFVRYADKLLELLRKA